MKPDCNTCGGTGRWETTTEDSPTTTMTPEEARTRLRELCPPGTTVYCVVEHRAPSGMLRYINAYVIRDGVDYWLSGYIRSMWGIKPHARYNGVRRAGGGMDMCFDLVYSLSVTLHGDGYALTHRTL